MADNSKGRFMGLGDESTGLMKMNQCAVVCISTSRFKGEKKVGLRSSWYAETVDCLPTRSVLKNTPLSFYFEPIESSD